MTFRCSKCWQTPCECLSRKPLDVNGIELRVGDKVRRVDHEIIRTVEAVATYEHLAGCVTVSGILGWCSAKRFEKVTT